MPEDDDVVSKCSNRRAIGWHGMVGEIPGDDLRKPFPGFRDRPVHSLSQCLLGPVTTKLCKVAIRGSGDRRGDQRRLPDNSAT